MEFYAVLKQRRSVRAYRPDPVAEEKLQRILEAARLAPTACNLQPFVIHVIRDPELRASLFKAYAQKWLTQAPVVICICADAHKAWRRGDGKSYADVDAAIVMEHVVLAATAEGLGTCWIGAFKPEPLRALLDLPPDMQPVAMTPVGVPAENPSPRPRKALAELVVYR